jgi:C4-dicarboxylate transporter DctM subunit
MLYIIAVALLRPEIAPAAQKYTWRERGVGLIRIGPTILLIIAVLGGLYMGWSTASEAAAVGCGGGIILGIFYRTFSWKAFSDAVSEAILISGMMLFIITGAAFYGTSVAYLGFSNAVMDWILSLGLSKWTIFIFLVVIYLILGCLMDGGSMLVLTIPIIYPTVQALQWDPIWFGVVLVILIEIAQITPPIGLNLYVLSGITNEPIGSIVIYSLPFFFIMMLMIVILALFPELATWLPSTIITRV